MADNLNVSFLRGTQTKLNSLSTYTPGAFYLTTDSDRLYFAQSDNELVYLNRYITTVNNQSELPDVTTVNVGDFYYVANGNILCTKATENGGYVQINPPDTDTSVESLTFATPKASDGNLTIECTLVQKSKYVGSNTNLPADKQPADIKGTITIKGSDIGAIVTGVSLDVSAEVANNKATVALNGSGVSEDATGFVLAAGQNVQITTNDSKEVVIGTHDYTFSSPENSKTLVLANDAKTEKGKVTIDNGTSNESIVVSGDKANEITISHKDYNYAGTDLQNQTAASGESFNIIAGLEVENGHVTNVKTSTVTMPTIKEYDIHSITAEANGKIKVALHDQADSDYGTTSESILYYKVGEDTLYNQSDLTTYFYTKEDIDSTLQSANAMTFKGSVGTGGTVTTLPTEGVKAGDTYIVVGGSVNGGDIGDLFVATGEETNGVLTNIEWINIPAGDDVNSTYKLKGNLTENSFYLVDQTNTITGKFILEDDDFVTAEVGAVDVTKDEYKITFNHKDSEYSGTPTDNGTATLSNEVSKDGVAVIDSVTVDEKGHITNISTKELYIPDIDHSLNVNGNTVTLKNPAGTDKGSFTLQGDGVISVNDLTVSHNKVETPTDTAKTANPAANGTDSFDVVSGVTRDDYGHITGVETTTVTMPNIDYKLSGAVSASGNIITVTDTLKDGASSVVGTSAFSLTSNTLTLSNSNNTITADLVWGSF